MYTHSIRDDKQAVRHVPYSPHTIFCLCLLMVTFLHCDTRYPPCYGFPWYLSNCVQRTGAAIWCLGRNYVWAKKLPVWHPLMHTYRYHQIFTRVIRYASMGHWYRLNTLISRHSSLILAFEIGLVTPTPAGFDLSIYLWILSYGAQTAAQNAWNEIASSLIIHPCVLNEFRMGQ